MIIVSLMAGFLSTMNIYTTKLDDIRFHLNDIYMVTLMTSLMMLFHFINNNSTQHILIFMAISILIFMCIRTQFLIDDTQFLNGMIPHHSMAVLMSQNIIKKTSNDKIKKLAQSIIDSQSKEIKEMNDILDEI
jgi:hypothetical protein